MVPTSRSITLPADATVPSAMIDAPAASPLRLMVFKDPNAGIGVALRLMLRYPAFARQPFGQWADVLAGQARRGHQLFVIDAASEVRGFLGYALASRPDAEAWAAGGAPLTDAQCTAGDCLVINAWVSCDGAARRFMLRELRRLGLRKQVALFRRVYPDGTVRTGSVLNARLTTGMYPGWMSEAGAAVYSH